MNQTVPQFEGDYTEILAFISLVLALSWVRFLPPILESTLEFELPTGLVLALTPIAAFSPLIGVLLVVGYRSGTGGVTSFLRTRLRWRIAPIWYLVALGFLPVLFASAFVVYVILGGSVPELGQDALLNIVTVFTIGVLFNLSENFGWRGYLQEKLQSNHSALAASLVVGAVWGLWHAPLFLLPDGPLRELPFGWYIILIIGLAVLFGWLYNETDGSVLAVTLMHCGFNAAIGTFVLALIAAGVDVTAYIVLSVLVTWIAVGIILLRAGPGTLLGAFSIA